MKKKISHFCLVLVCVLFASTTIAQPLLRKTFKLPPNVSGFVTGDFNKVIKTSDGGYVFSGVALTGWSYEPEMDGNIYEEPMTSAFLIKTDSAFNQQWGKVYEELQYFRTYTSEEATYTISDLVDNQNGTFSILLHFYFGVFGGPEDTYDRIITFNNAGNIILDNAPSGFLYNSTEEGLRGSRCLLIDPSANSTIYTDIDDYIMGNMTGEQLTLKTTSSGAFDWATNISNDGGTRFVSAHYIPSSGNYLFAGVDSNNDLYVVETTNSGTVVWAKTYGGAGVETVASIIPTTGGYYIAGGTNSSGAGSFDILLQKIDLTGNPVFAKTYGTSGSEVASGITVKGTTIYITSSNRLIQTDLSGNLLQAFTGIGGAICQNDLSATSLVFANGPAQRTDLNGNINGACVTTSFTPTVNTFNSNATSVTVTQTALSITPGNTSGGTSGLLSTTENIVCSAGPCAVTAVITAAGPTTFCSGGSVILNANTGAGLSYQWKLNGVDIAGQTASSYTATTSGSYSCVVTIACGSLASNAISVTATTFATPVIFALGGTTNFCPGSYVTLILSTAQVGLAYQWKLNGSNVSGQTGNTLNTSTAGTYTCFVSGTCGTGTSNSITVTTLPLPTGTITPAGPLTICPGGNVTLNATVAAGYSYQWKLNGSNISFQTSASYVASAAGVYTCAVSNNCGTVTSNSVTITVGGPPTASITAAGPTTFCSGGNVTLNANTGAGLSYQWKLNGSNWAGQTSASLGGTTVAGVYTCVVTNSCGSATSNSITVVVNSIPTVSIAPAAGTQLSCAIPGVVLNATAPGATSYQWYAFGGVSAISGANSSSYTASSPDNFQCIASNACGSSAISNTIYLTQNGPILPVVTIYLSATGGTSTVCPNTLVSIALTSSVTATYQWQLNNVNIAGATGGGYGFGSAGNYTCLATNACGTDTSNVITVTHLPAPPIPPVTASGPTTICAGQNVTFTTPLVAGYTYVWKRSNTVLGSTTNSVTVATAGTYSVTVDDGTCPTSSGGYALTVNPQPTATITASTPVTLCTGGGVVMNANTGAGLSYQWQKASVNIAGATNSTYTATTAGSYRVIVTNANGCTKNSNSIAAAFTGTSVTSAITVTGSTTFCSGSSGTSLKESTSVPGYGYQWNLNGIPIAGATSDTYIPVASGNYSVTVTASCGSSISAQQLITVNAVPIVSITAPNGTSLCPGPTAELDATGSNIVSYQWQFNGSNISGATGAIYNASLVGDYLCVTTNACGTATSNVLTITVGTQPTSIISAGGPTTFCPGGNVALNASTGVGYSYQWQLNNSDIVSATNSSYSATSAGSYTCVVTNICGTATSNAIVVTTYNTPAASITAGGSTSFCTGGNVTLTANSGTGYQWKNNTIDIAGATSQSYLASTAGNYAVEVTSLCGSSTSAATAVTIISAPTATITPSGSTTVCSGSVVLNANTGAGLTYQWKNNGVDISGAMAANYSATSSGNYTVVVTASGGCSATSSPVTVTIGALSAALAPAGTTSICAGNTITLTASSGTGYTYKWYRNNVLLSNTASSYTTTSDGTFKCVITSGTCTATTNSSIVKQIVNPTPAVTYSSPLSFCSPGSVTLTANTFTGVIYQWENNSVPIAGATSQNYVATGPGLYRCNETANGCSRYTGKVSVSAAASVVAVISTNDPTTLCSGGSVNMNINNPIPGYSYQWKNNGVVIAGATATAYAATSSGSYTVTATASCGTTTSNAIAVSIGSFAAQVTPAGNVAMCTGGSLTLTANTGTGFTYQWMNGGVNIAGATNATLNVTASGSYSVAMTSPCGNGTSAATVVTQNTVTASLSPAGTSTVCSGTAQTFTANTGTGYTYRWYRNNVLLTATTPTYTTSTDGSYKVEVSISGSCALLSNTAVLAVINNPTPTITASGPTTFCAGGNVTLTANTFAGVTYQWQKNSVNIAGATSQSYIATTAGTYRANETANGCSKFTPKKAVTVNCRLAGEDASDDVNLLELKVYPNPFNDKINIQLSSNNDATVILKVTDVVGRVICNENVNANTIYTIGENMSSGVYFVEARQNDMIKTIRIVKK